MTGTGPVARKAPGDLRSARWFGPADLRSFGHRSRIAQMGYGPEDWQGRPCIDDELDRRRAAWTPPAPRYERGYGWMFSRYIRQANEGWTSTS